MVGSGGAPPLRKPPPAALLQAELSLSAAYTQGAGGSRQVAHAARHDGCARHAAAALLRGDAGAPDMGGDRGRGGPSRAEGRHTLPAGTQGAAICAPLCGVQEPSLPADGFRGPTRPAGSDARPCTTAARRWRWRVATPQAPACRGSPARLAGTAGTAHRTPAPRRVSGQRPYELDRRDNEGHGADHHCAQEDRVALLRLTDGKFEASLRPWRKTRTGRTWLPAPIHHDTHRIAVRRTEETGT